MKAVGYKTPGPIDRDDALVDVTLETPRASGRDLLVEIRAVSVNPVDTKVRRRAGAEGYEWKVLGYDAAGVVAVTGEEVSGFRPGDEVWYSGSIARQGTNSEFHLVDERIVGRKPRTLSFAEAAALPLTTITAWEMLFDRLDIRKPVPGAADAVLIIGGAGGVGSIAIQLVRVLTGLTVIATASRPETRDWVRALGAHHMVDHTAPLAEQVAALGIGAPGLVFCTTQTDRHQSEIEALIAPQGRFGLIDDPIAFNVLPFKRKAVSIHWEMMFARPVFGTPDMGEQGRLLNEVADLVDAGRIRTTLTESAGRITAADLKAAHARIESGTARGKIVLEGF
ncbi:MAG: zinc-binding alcohol dehydrogenase family protein [Rhodobacteraceae bacterium]|nr:zinc-binding alcohol dehydrogenase family protein [Paracoccaceae bacterium]